MNYVILVISIHKLDIFIEITTFNVKIKRKELMIEVYYWSNEDKNWSQSPTFIYIINLAESMIIQKKISGSKNYTAHRSVS